MLLWLTDFLQQYYPGFRVFQYLTFRSILATLSSFSIALFLGPWLISRLQRLEVAQTVRPDGPRSHYAKSGTPTMGGALILVAVCLSTLLWSDWTNRYVWIVLLTTVGFGLIGAFDDYRKLKFRRPHGLKARWKFIWQLIVCGVVVWFLYVSASSAVETALIVPFFKQVSIQLGYFFPVLAFFVVVGSSNAVNLTDGLDGLAILPTVLVAGALGVFAYAAGNASFAHYLSVPHVVGSGEVVVFLWCYCWRWVGFFVV